MKGNIAIVLCFIVSLIYFIYSFNYALQHSTILN